MQIKNRGFVYLAGALLFLLCARFLNVKGQSRPMQSSEPAASAANGILYDLRCNYLVSPLGIDELYPTLSWKWQTEKKSPQGLASQSDGPPAYFAITVSTDSALLAATQVPQKEVFWYSGFRSSDRNFTHYQGPPFKPYTRYYWKIIYVSDTTKPSSAVTAISYLETGLQTEYNWKGAWISDNHPIGFKPAGYFRHDFTLEKAVKSARIYISAAGLYKLTLNGQPVGDRELDPVYSRFDRRLYYTTYDVTQALCQSQNALGVILGNGWFNLQSTAVWDFDKAPWRARPAFVLDLRVVYKDGTVETFSTDKAWKTRTGPIIFNSIYTAEHHDHRLALHGWDQPHKKGDDWHRSHDSLWQDVIYRSAPSKNVSSAMLVPIRKSAPIETRSMQKFSDTDYVFDIGQNIAGISEIKVSGRKGTVLRVKHGERLYKNGHVDLSNIDVHYRPTDNSDPFQTDIYILSGAGEETFRPFFGYKGFQYVEITSSEPVHLDKSAVTAYFMHSDVPVAGLVHSSDKILNRIWAATNQSYLSNLMGYPTDCPQREKNGWTGDGQINIQTGLYNFDAITVYKKWMQDHLDEQQPNGVLPSIIPTDGWGYEWGNGPDWTSTIAVIPWNLYLFYGDSEVLRHCYEAIKHYVDYITHISPSGICSWGLGDWVPVKSKTPVPFTSTIYYYTDVRILAAAARLFNKQADYENYHHLAEKIKKAFNDKWLNKESAIYDQGFQTEMSAPLYWGLVPDGYQSRVAAALNQRVQQDGYRLDVGLLGSKTILDALSMYGYHNTAYKMASSRTFPSWGWWMVNGATTLYENWNIQSKNDISLNHIMFGQIGAWLYRGLGGIIPDADSPGFKHTILRPAIPDSLENFRASHQTPYGQVAVSWHKMKRKGSRSNRRSKGNAVTLSVAIPPGTTATLYAPAGYRPEPSSQGNSGSRAADSWTFGDNSLSDAPYEGLSRVVLSGGKYEFVLQKMTTSK